MLHKYQIGQKVRYHGGFAQRHLIGGSYEVVAQMPERDGDNQYKIKRNDDPHQRVVNEAELAHERGEGQAGALFHGPRV